MTVRILLVGVPRMLSDVLHEVLHDPPEMVVARSRADGATLWSVCARVDVDVVLVGNHLDRPHGPLECLAMRRPDMVVLSISSDGREVWDYEVRPTRTLVEDASPAGIRDLVRRAAASRAALVTLAGEGSDRNGLHD